MAYFQNIHFKNNIYSLEDSDKEKMFQNLKYKKTQQNIYLEKKNNHIYYNV